MSPIVRDVLGIAGHGGETLVTQDRLEFFLRRGQLEFQAGNAFRELLLFVEVFLRRSAGNAARRSGSERWPGARRRICVALARLSNMQIQEGGRTSRPST